MKNHLSVNHFCLFSQPPRFSSGRWRELKTHRHPHHSGSRKSTRFAVDLLRPRQRGSHGARPDHLGSGRSHL